MVSRGRGDGLGGGGGSELGGGLGGEPSRAYVGTEYVCWIYAVDNYEVSLWNKESINADRGF